MIYLVILGIFLILFVSFILAFEVWIEVTPNGVLLWYKDAEGDIKCKKLWKRWKR